MAGASSAEGPPGGEEPGDVRDGGGERRQLLGLVGDAEDVCVGFLLDVLDDIFSEMRATEEATRCVQVAAAAAWGQVLDGCRMAAMVASPTMDHTLSHTRSMTDATGGAPERLVRWAQILRPRVDDDEDNDANDHDAPEALGHARGGGAGASPSPPRSKKSPGPKGPMPTAPRPVVVAASSAVGVLQRRKRRRRHRTHNRPGAPVVAFLGGLWRVLERRRPWVETMLAGFPTARFQPSAVPSVGRAGEWELPAEDLGTFLHGLAIAAPASALWSTVEFVMTANASLLTKKTRAQGHLQPSHVELCVQNALLVAEELAERIELEEDEEQKTREAPSASGGGGIGRVFQTELLEDAADVEALAAWTRRLLVCWDAGRELAPPTIDRSATNQLPRKALAGAQAARKQRLARDVVMLLRQSTALHGGDSKWDAIRRRLFVTPEAHVGLSVEADMSLRLVGPPPTHPRPSVVLGGAQRKASATEGAGAPTAAASGRGGGSTSPKRGSSVRSPSSSSSTTATATATTSNKSPQRNAVQGEPDVAALSNIFSLGTPRQLSAEELARRNDILALLEREEQRTSRRMAVATFAALSVPACVGADGKPILSENDREFQAYAATVSSVIMTNGSCHPPRLDAGDRGHEPSGPPSPSAIDSDNKRSPDKAASRKAPTTTANAIVPTGRTKFDLALEPPAFEIVEGRPQGHDANGGSPNKRARSRGTTTMTTTSMRAAATLRIQPSPPASPLPSPVASSHVRPVETASGQLPQLDTSRLAVGVKAVVRGVEKRGPRHSPSRNSRLRLHNYSTEAPGPVASSSMVSATGESGPHAAGPREQLPPVSPTKVPHGINNGHHHAQHHRRHVTFPQVHTEAHSPVKPPLTSPPPATSEHESPMSVAGASPSSRRFPAKQPTWERRTSPPRIRNRHHPHEGKHHARKLIARQARADPEHSQDDDDDNGVHQHQQPPNAPRRNLRAYHNLQDDDDDGGGGDQDTA